MTEGQAIRIVRVIRGFSQAEVAELAGVQAATLCRIESGQRTARRSTVEKLAGAMGVRVMQILVMEQMSSDEILERIIWQQGSRL